MNVSDKFNTTINIVTKFESIVDLLPSDFWCLRCASKKADYFVFDLRALCHDCTKEFVDEKEGRNNE